MINLNTMNSGIKYSERLSKTSIKSGEIYGNRYRLVKSLGKGGYGCVWECEDMQQDNQKLAIKILPPHHINPRSLQRFYDEIKIMNEHGGNSFIMPIYSWYTPKHYNKNSKRQCYYVMPIAKGDGLMLLGASMITKIQAIKDIFDVLEYLHSNQIAHRDIKLQNILLYQDKYILSDYGLVTYPNKKQITRWREPIGPFENFDPLASFSQDIHDSLHSQIDIYEFAKVIWTLLSGKKGPSFRGQYNHCGIESIRRYLPKRYSSHKLDRLLTISTSLDINERPTIIQMKKMFEEWWSENQDHTCCHDLLWKDLLYRIFPEHIPECAFWVQYKSIKQLLKIFAEYQMCFKCSNKNYWQELLSYAKEKQNTESCVIQYCNNSFVINFNKTCTLTLKKK